MLKKLLSFILICIVLSSITVFAAPSEWAADEVYRARSEKLIPDRLKSDYQNQITREEFCELVMLLFEKLGGTVPEVQSSPFEDTQNPSVLAAHELGIVLGVGNGAFAPDLYITRQEICTMMTRALTAAVPSITLADSYPNTFPDIDMVDDWALLYVKYMNMKGIILGDEKGNINPFDNTTREQAIILSYRLYDALQKELSGKIIDIMFSSSGNIHSNMQNGGFAIATSSQAIYTAGQDGIKNGAETVVDAPSKNLYAYDDRLYYINETDGGIYKYSNGTAQRLTSDSASAFVIYSDYIYYVNESDNGFIYKVKTDGSDNTAVTDKRYSLPAPSGNALYYSDGEKIIKHAVNKDPEIVYEGYSSKLTISNGVLYFLNEEGIICSYVEKDKEFTALTRVPALAFSPTSNHVIYVGTDGHMYKTDLKGRASIMIDDGIYVSVNTYNDYVFGKTADGEIYRFKTDSTDKMRIN